MYRLRHMDVNDKVCEQVDVALLAQVYPKAVMKRCVGAKSALGRQSATGAPEYGAGPGVVCDRDGVVEFAQPEAWSGTNWWANSRPCIPASQKAS